MSCPDCKTGDFLPGSPAGKIKRPARRLLYAGAAAEQSSAGNEVEGSQQERPRKRAILLLTDGFGLPLKNSKIIADNLAKRLQCDVWVPDYFNGRPLIPLDALILPDHAGVKLGLLDWVTFYLGQIKALPRFIQNRPAVALPRLTKFIEALKWEKKYEQLGVVGYTAAFQPDCPLRSEYFVLDSYCYGGSMAVKLGSTGLVHSVVICHPGPMTLNDVKAIKVPAAWVCAEEDFFFRDSFRRQVEAVFAERKGTDKFVEYEFKDYKGTTHGFAARPNLALPDIKEAHEKAFEQTVEWFEKTLKL